MERLLPAGRRKVSEYVEKRPLIAFLLCAVVTGACDVAPVVASSTSTVTTAAPAGSRPTSSTTVAPTTTVASATEPIDIGPLQERGGHSVIWTGEEMIVWGGERSDGGTRLADGAGFDPVSDTWRVIAAAPLSPRLYHVAAWTDEEMLVVGGVGERDGAAYSPATDTWKSIEDSPIPLESHSIDDMAVGSVWTGQELIVWSISTNQVAAYAPDFDTWRILPPIGLTGDTGVLRWTGESLYAFADTLSSYPADTALTGARLNQEGGWEPIPAAEFSTDDLIVGAHAKLTAWAGDRFVAWSDSGFEGKTLAFSPGDQTWTEVGAIPIPPCDGQGEPVQAGDRVIAFGWCGSNVATLDPTTGSWTTAPVIGYPTARYTVWTGSELLNWGGGYYTVDAWRYPTPD